MSSAFYVSSFIEILHFVSEDLIQCDAGTTISELFSDSVWSGDVRGAIEIRRQKKTKLIRQRLRMRTHKPRF